MRIALFGPLSGAGGRAGQAAAAPAWMSWWRFRGLGLLHADLMPALDRYGTRGLRTLLDDHGIVDLELELLTDWWTAGPARERSDRIRHDLLTAAESLGALHIKIAPDVADMPWDHDRWVTEFAGLAADAANAGTRVGLEFLPWSNIKTVHNGLRIARDADTAAGGLVIDVWHTERVHTPPTSTGARRYAKRSPTRTAPRGAY